MTVGSDYSNECYQQGLRELLEIRTTSPDVLRVP
jgi:hypothetical protein